MLLSMNMEMSSCVGSAETFIQTCTLELFSKGKFCPRGALSNCSTVYYNCCIQSGPIGYTSCCSRAVFADNCNKQISETCSCLVIDTGNVGPTGETGDVNGTGTYLIFKPYTGFLLEYRYTTVYYSQ